MARVCNSGFSYFQDVCSDLPKGSMNAVHFCGIPGGRWEDSVVFMIKYD